MSDYYQILGIDRQASTQQVKSAFKKLALQYHPDRNPGNPAAEEKFKQINEAYQVLSDADDKRLYDLRLDGQYSQSPSYETYQQTEHKYTYTQTPTYTPRYTYTPAQSRKAYLVGTLILIIIAVCGYSFYNFMNHTMAQSHYAEALEQLENNDLYSAFMQLEEALHFDNEYAEAYLKRGQLHLSVGKGYLYAYSDFNHAIRYAESPIPEMYFFRGLCLYRMGEYAKVIQDCKQAIQQQALRGPAIFLQAAAKKALQDNTGACQDWQQAYTLGIISSADSIRVYCQ